MGANADDVALVIKLQKRVKALEVVKNKLTNELEERDDNENGKERIGGDLAYESLKVYATPATRRKGQASHNAWWEPLLSPADCLF